MSLMDSLLDAVEMASDPDILGVSAQYTPLGGITVSVNVIFWNPFYQSTLTGIGADNLSPYCLGLSSVFSAATRGDSIDIDSVSYYVIGVEPDGNGMVRLILSEDEP